MLSVYSLLKAGLLLLNALAVLHPGRFLRVYGIVESSEDASAKSRLASTLAWSRGLQCASAGRGAARSNALPAPCIAPPHHTHLLACARCRPLCSVWLRRAPSLCQPAHLPYRGDFWLI